MKNYQVEVETTVYVTVKADSEEQAEQQAKETVRQGGKFYVNSGTSVNVTWIGQI